MAVVSSQDYVVFSNQIMHDLKMKIILAIQNLKLNSE